MNIAVPSGKRKEKKRDTAQYSTTELIYDSTAKLEQDHLNK